MDIHSTLVNHLLAPPKSKSVSSMLLSGLFIWGIRFTFLLILVVALIYNFHITCTAWWAQGVWNCWFLKPKKKKKVVLHCPSVICRLISQGSDRFLQHPSITLQHTWIFKCSFQEFYDRAVAKHSNPRRLARIKQCMWCCNCRRV